jgi:hypothetical protein
MMEFNKLFKWSRYLVRLLLGNRVEPETTRVNYGFMGLCISQNTHNLVTS